MLYGQFRKQLEEIFSGLSMQRQCRFVEDYHMPDHVHMLLQSFWTRRDVVFTVGEVEQSISAVLEPGTSGLVQYKIIIPESKIKSQGLFLSCFAMSLT